MTRTFTDPSYHAAYIAHHAKVPARRIILGKPDNRDPRLVKAWATRRAQQRAIDPIVGARNA